MTELSLVALVNQFGLVTNRVMSQSAFHRFMRSFGQPQQRASWDSGAQFVTTHWTSVLSSQRSTPQGKQALERLCHLYWPPLYSYVRRRGYSPEEAQDLTQGFFASFLGRNDLAQVDPKRGRFRSFLLTSLKNFLANEWNAAQAQKRGGGQANLSWEEDALEREYQLVSAVPATPETLYERRWALSILEQALERLSEEYSQSGRRDLFDELRGFLSGDKKLVPQAEIAAKFGMSVSAVRVNVHRLRQRYGELLRVEVGTTVSSPAEIEEEIRYLMAVLAR